MTMVAVLVVVMSSCFRCVGSHSFCVVAITPYCENERPDKEKASAPENGHCGLIKGWCAAWHDVVSPGVVRGGKWY